MTGESLRAETMGPLGRRFVAAFALVALLAVALVTAAALVGTNRGFSSQSDHQRHQAAEEAGAAAADAYRRAEGWGRADLGRASALAAGAGAVLVVRDRAGDVVWAGSGHSGGRGPMPGMGMMGRGPVEVTAPVTVSGERVGTVGLRFRPAVTSGRPVAWAWILAAAVAALVLALVSAWFVSRHLTRPVSALTAAARSFAAGDRSAFVRTRGVGELGELADAFDDAVTAVRTAERSRQQMAADVAHELRTPLAALQAGLEELRDGLAPADPQALAMLHDQALRVGRVVRDLDALFAAEGTGTGVRRDRVDLVEVASQEVAARAAQLRVAELTLVTALPPDPVWVRGDAERLHQVLGNLLENCVRHCRPGDRVTVTVDADGPALAVEDTGPGIAPADLEHVFDRFWRGPTQTGRPGSGLGLAVVRGLAEAQGGSVSAQSDGRSGSTFTVTLPAWRDAHRGPRERAAPVPGAVPRSPAS
jgi:two-component system sensor histidine kinase BaeS